MTRSEELFERARQLIPGGVNSPVRAFRPVGGAPLFLERGEGPYVVDVDGRPYIDYVGSWGPAIVGHAHPEVIRAVQETAARGLGFGAPSELEIEMAERLCRWVPSMERVRLVSSGTEATMSALRLARGYTGRNKVLKFAGCYHGHVDALLVEAGSGALTLGVPSSPGVPTAVSEDTITTPFNDIEMVKAAFQRYGTELAAVIVEPVAGNMNCVPPVDGFLEELRRLCTEYGSVLLFDEVMTGFRVGPGGAQQRFRVTPDLTALGKVVGGGMPVGAFGGRADIMDHLAPVGPVYQAGTLAGNPVTMAAGLATLRLLEEPGFYESLERRTSVLAEGLHQRARAAGVPMTTNQVGGMFGYFFTDEPEVRYHRQVAACDMDRFRKFFNAMLARGIYFAPSAFEAGFVSSAHDDDVIQETLNAAENALAGL